MRRLALSGVHRVVHFLLVADVELEVDKVLIRKHAISVSVHEVEHLDHILLLEPNVHLINNELEVREGNIVALLNRELPEDF